MNTPAPEQLECVLLRISGYGDFLGWRDTTGNWRVVLPVGTKTGPYAKRTGYDLTPPNAKTVPTAELTPAALGDTISPRGTAFQQRVWAALRAIPPGEIRTYAQIAQIVGCGSAQAVGNAIAANPVAIGVPCHRVLPAGGGLGGFAWGSATKRRWLAEEGIRA